MESTSIETEIDNKAKERKLYTSFDIDNIDTYISLTL